MGDKHPTDLPKTLGDKLHYLAHLDPGDVKAVEVLVDEAIARHERERWLELTRLWRPVKPQ